MSNQLDIFGVKFKAEDVAEFVRSISSISIAFSKVFDALAKVDDGVKKTNAVFESQAKSLKKVSEYSKQTEKSINELAKSINAGEVEMKHISDTVKAVADVTARLRVQVGLTENSLTQNNKVLTDSTVRLKAFDNENDLTAISMAVLEGKVKLTEKGIAKYLSTVSKSNVVIKTHAIQLEEAAAAQKKLEQETKKLDSAYAKLNKLGAEGVRRAKELAKSYSDGGITLQQLISKTDEYSATIKKNNQVKSQAEVEFKKLKKVNADLIASSDLLKSRLTYVNGVLKSTKTTAAMASNAMADLKIAFSVARKELNTTINTDKNIAKFTRTFDEASKKTNELSQNYYRLITQINNGLPYTEAAQKMGKLIAEQKRAAIASQQLSIAWGKMREIQLKIGNDPRFNQKLIDISTSLSNGKISALSATKAFEKVGQAFDATKRKAEIAALAARELVATFGHLATIEQGKFAPAFNEIIEKLKRTDITASEARVAIKELINTMKTAGVNTNKLFPVLEAQKFEQNVKSLVGTNKQLAKSYTDLAAKVKAGSLSAAQATAEFNKLRNAADKATGGFHLMQSALNRLSYRVISAIEFALYDAVKAISIYDQALKSMQAITSSTDAATAAMGQKLKEVSVSTRASLDDVAKGMQFLGQAGLSAAESIATIEAVGALATGTLEDVSKVADLVSSTMRAFNIEAVDSTRIVDVMANAINKSKLDVDKLRVAFSYVGATANQVGLSLEETAATMMTLADAGVRASTLGTGLRQILARLESPSKNLREAFVELGIEIENLSIKNVGMEKVLENLSKVLTNSETGAIDTGKAYKLFGVWAANSAVRIVDAFNSGQYQEALDNVYRTGAAAEMSAKQMEGLDSKLKNLRYTLEVVFINTLGSDEMMSMWKNLIDKTKSYVLWVEKLVLVLIKLGSIASKLVPEQNKLNGYMGTFSRYILLSKIAVNSLLNELTKLDHSLMSEDEQRKKYLFNLEKEITLTTHSVAVMQNRINKLNELQRKNEGLSVSDVRVQESIKELIKAYPMQEAEILKNANAVENLISYMEKLRLAEQDQQIKGSIELLAEKSKKMNELVESVKKTKDGYYGVSGSVKDYTQAQINNMKVSDEYLLIEREFNEILTGLKQTFKANINAGKNYNEQINIMKSALEAAGIGVVQIDAIMKNFIATQKNLKLVDPEKLTQEEAEIKDTLSQMSAAWNNFYNELTDREKVAFLQSAKNLTEKQANFNKYLNALDAEDKVKTEMRLAFEIKMLQEQGAKVIEERIKRGKLETTAAIVSSSERNEAELKLIRKLNQQIIDENAKTLFDLDNKEREADIRHQANKTLSVEQLNKKLEDLHKLYGERREALDAVFLEQFNILAEEERKIIEKISKQKIKTYELESAQRSTLLKQIEFELGKELITKEQAEVQKAEIAVSAANEQLKIQKALMVSMGELYGKDHNKYKTAQENKKAAAIDLATAVQNMEKAKLNFYSGTTNEKDKLVKESNEKEQELDNKTTENTEKNAERKKRAIKGLAASWYQWVVNLDISLEEAGNRVMAVFFSFGRSFEFASKKFTAYASEYNKLIEMAKEHGMTIDVTNKSLNQSIELFKQKLSIVDTYRGQIDEIVKTSNDLSRSIEDWKKGVETTDLLKTRFDELAEKISKLNHNSMYFNELIDQMMNRTNDSLTEAVSLFPQLSSAIESLKDEMYSMGNASQEKLDEIMETYTELVDVGSEYIESLKNSFDELITLNDEIVTSVIDIKTSYTELFDEFGDWKEETKGFGEQLDTFTESMLESGKSIKEIIPDLLSEYTNIKSELENLVEKEIELKDTSVESLTEMKTATDEAYAAILETVKTKIESMKSLWETLKTKVEEVNEKILEINKTTEETIRDLRQKTMTEEQKWNDDRKLAEELFTKGKAAESKKQYTIAEEYYKQATTLAKGLAVEVTDSNGEITRSLSENVGLSISLIEEISGRYESMLKKQKSGIEGQIQSAEYNLDYLIKFAESASLTMEDVLGKVQDAIIKRQGRFTSEIDRTNDALSTMIGLLNRQLNPNTLFDMTNSMSYAPPLIGSSFIPNSNNYLSEGGYVSKSGAPTNRDTIPAMLSNNEFVINSEAVKKYGTGFFSALNKMELPKEAMRTFAGTISNLKDNLQGFMNGGLAKPRFAFAGGGLVGSNSTTNNSTSNNYYSGNFTINGAGKQAKEIAIEVDKILTDRARYNRSAFYKMVK